MILYLILKKSDTESTKFDGDEMNIHVPQTIQTVTELLLICNATKRFVSPTSSKIAISVKQDTLMGSYLQSYDHILIDWKDAMNILMNTSVKLDVDIPKHTKIAGKLLYSQIVPSSINIESKKDGVIERRIHNGVITHGLMGKGIIQDIVQKIWFQTGSNATQVFIDDLQKMILQWLMRYGFTVGIQDTVVPESVTADVKKIIETKRKEILTIITEYENDPYIMTKEAHEVSIRANLMAVTDDLQKAVMPSFKREGGISTTVASGSSGGEINCAQITGAVGQVVVDSVHGNVRIPKNFNNRTLPMFCQHDDSAFARGFCYNSFVSGLGPAEFFFHVMAGRDGVINTAIKTADTGYIQRKLIKVLEDIKVEYDGTVRNANDKIIQMIYGDNGISTEKQVSQKIQLIGLNNKSVRDRYIYNPEELKSISNANSKYTKDLNDALYNKLISMRDKMRQIQKSCKNVSLDFEESYMMPVDLLQFITNIKSRDDRPNTNLVDPYYVLAKIKSMYSGEDSKIMKYREGRMGIKQKDENRIRFLLKFYLYDILCPKRCTQEYKLSDVEFDEILEYFKRTIMLSRVEGGEMVGFVAAQSIGEPVTQTNLKSFHKAGSGKTVAGGLVRVKELLGVTKNLKTPMTKIILDEKYGKDKVTATKIASFLKYTTIKDVVDTVAIYYDPKPSSPTSVMNQDGVDNIFEGGQGKYGCQTEIHGLPWIVRITLSKDKMNERNVNMLELKTSFCHNWAMRYEDSKGAKKEYKKVIDKITQCAIITNYDNSPVPIIHIRFDANNYNFNTLIQFQDMIINRYKIKGLTNIVESNNVVKEEYIDFDDEGNKIQKERYVIITDGINLSEMTQINGINLKESFCNDIVTIYETYGVEAARTAFIREFVTALGSSGGYSNYQHIAVLADAVTHMGGLIPVNRHGANKLDTDPFSRASFEKTVEQLLAAAIFGESDHIRSVSARIMVGTLINGGTGCFDLLLDHEKVKKTLTKIKPPSKEIVIKKSNIADLIKKKKAGSIKDD